MTERDELIHVLRRYGLRATPQRQAILDAVRTSGGHFTAEAVFDRVRADLSTISLKTVYETLHTLANVGEVLEIDLGIGPIRFDAVLHPHHHVICFDCNRIEDIEVDVDGIAPEQYKGFSIFRTQLIAWGHCPDCRNRLD